MLDKVNNYYRSNLSSLPFGKRFHFGSRVWLWSQDEEMANFLRSVRAEFCCDGNLEQLNDTLTTVINTPMQDFGAKNAATERKPYFEKYPLLRQSLLAMFRLLFTKTIYGIDSRVLLANHFDISELDEMEKRLIGDKDALSTLSTHAVNFLYLYNRFYKSNDNGIAVDFLLSHAETMDTSSNLDLLLYIYFVTHCVIGESLFYKRHIPQNILKPYIDSILRLESTVEQRYDDVNMDNKFEMLVCFRILGLESRLSDQIYQEAAVTSPVLVSRAA
jgi:hypothetical protein